MKLKQDEDFDFCIGSALYKMQQRLTGKRIKYIESILDLSNNRYIVDKDMNYYKVVKVHLSAELKNMNIGYYSINYKGNNINVWSARDNFRICI